MHFSPFELFTVLFITSSFMLLFMFITSFNSVVLRIPITVVYIVLAMIGVRLLLPIEISKLSYEVNSYKVMAKINDISQYSVYENHSNVFTAEKLFYVVWGIGAIVSLYIYFRGYFHFRNETSKVPVIFNETISKQLELINTKFNFNYSPKVLINEGVDSPSEFGFLRQTIFINEYDYTDTEFYYILLHEMVHYHIKTNWAKLGMMVVTSIFWWNPIMHLFNHHFENLMELYVDNFIVKNSSPKEKNDYMETLLNVYKVTSENENKNNAFVNSMALKFRKNILLNRFKAINKKLKTNIPMCISIILMAIACFASTVCFVFQPAYEPTEDDMPSIKSDISSYYVVEENGIYKLYNNNGECIAISQNKDDFAVFLK